MGKLIHKLVRGIMPSWLFSGFKCIPPSSKKLLHLRLKQSIQFTSSKSSAPVLPSSSSAPLNKELVDLLIEMDQSIYFYSQSEDEPEQAITGNSNRITSPSIEGKSLDGGGDDDDQIHATQNPRMGICALAAASIIQGTRHEDKFKLPAPHQEIEYPTSPASIHLQSHHDNDIHLQNHQQEECLDHPYPIQHQTRKLKTSKETGVMKGNHHNGHGGHSWQHRHRHQALPDKNLQQHHVADGPAQANQHHVADGPAQANQHCRHHANNEPRTTQRPQHHAGNAAFCQNDDLHAHSYHHYNHYMYHHAGDGTFCQHDDGIYHYAHQNQHNNNMYKDNHDAGDGSLYMHDDDVYHYAHQHDHKNHVCEYHHHGQGYGSNNLLSMSKEGRTKPNIESHPMSSFARGAKTETQHNHDHQHQHHDQFQNGDQFYQHNASKIDYYEPFLRGLKRKSMYYLDGIDGREDGKDEGNYHRSMSTWPCVKRQRTHKGDNVACELPECITEKVGDSCAIVQYSYQNPEFAFWESMMQMIVSNELWDNNELQFLLQCYLALNDPHLHHIIHTSFLLVLKDLQQRIYELGWIK